jgi:hypothetical protein
VGLEYAMVESGRSGIVSLHSAEKHGRHRIAALIVAGQVYRAW